MSSNQSKKSEKASPPVTIVIFGASGDLTHRKLIPALFSLACDHMLHSNTDVIGVGRTKFSDEDFRQHLYDGVKE